MIIMGLHFFMRRGAPKGVKNFREPGRGNDHGRIST